ncbi:deacetylase [Pyrobaculum neutrophilum]|uniref:Histone deacetylase superfamily n=1 Tax=Pyrobaculum neutrophilum (strain DSM 2338 / JCM 9278 / NBRC 100436 / V24Sta) TaxID=444157 RepID=B1YA85_PYRNV|nr:deacetylase [Pyrobaculum neutrophilum]ACB39059.1 conserved hypothetical protein [Pyrobaculum neutrophilum V24Sta]
MLLVHADDGRWVARVLRELGAEAVEGVATWDEVRLIHSEMFVKAVAKHEAEVLAAAAVANAALAKGRAVFYVGGTAMAGLHAPRSNQLFNAAVYIAKRSGAAVISIDRHFPTGTWELHLEHGFPLYLVYGGAEGPTRRQLAGRREATAFPLPPGVGDGGFWKIARHVLEQWDGPVVIQLGFDIHREDPTGYLFASETFYHKLGRALAGREFYISIECPSTPRVLRAALEALLSGITGGPPPRADAGWESPEAAREVDRMLKSARRPARR